MLTPAQRSIRARIAARTRWAGESGKANAERAQAGLRARFVREARERFPELPEDEIARRAESAFRAHMSRLALKSSKARTDGGDDVAEAVEAEAELRAVGGEHATR